MGTRVDWLLWLMTAVFILTASSWLWEFYQLTATEKAAEARDADLMARVEQNRVLVENNREKLDAMIQQAKLGPRHTSCDTVKILADARRLGMAIPHQPVEDRCP